MKKTNLLYVTLTKACLIEEDIREKPLALQALILQANRQQLTLQPRQVHLRSPGLHMGEIIPTGNWRQSPEDLGNLCRGSDHLQLENSTRTFHLCPTATSKEPEDSGQKGGYSNWGLSSTGGSSTIFQHKNRNNKSKKGWKLESEKSSQFNVKRGLKLNIYTEYGLRRHADAEALAALHACEAL